MIKKIAVIGTGVIGTGWIIRFLAHDKKVIAYDKNSGKPKTFEGTFKPSVPYSPLLNLVYPRVEIDQGDGYIPFSFMNSNQVNL